MASSSNHISDESFDLDESFDEMFDKYFDQTFEQTFENLCNVYGDQQDQRKKKKKRVFIERNREEGHLRLWNDYFSDAPTYPANLFRRRFRMNKPLFMYIVDRLSNEVQFFRQKKDVTGRQGLSPLQKCTAAIRVLAYGYALDAVDEYLRLGATTVRLCVKIFVEAIINLFGDEYLRRPTPDDLQRLLYIGEVRGFPGMIGSIDCMHWEWKNCPTAWKGQYSRDRITESPLRELESRSRQRYANDNINNKETIDCWLEIKLNQERKPGKPNN
uniref:Nuclease HARBI1 n=1 Tax=Brassica oleracea var. oleracea TaxID=109376 RepID=A0A0D3CIE8_BRAOL